MTILHIREQGAVVRRNGDRIEVTRTDKKAPHTAQQPPRTEVLLSEPVYNVEQLNIYGNVQVTTQALALLLQREIEVIFLSLSGGYRGQALRNGSKHALMRQRQLFIASDEQKSLVLAVNLVAAKMTAQRNVLRSWTEATTGERAAALSAAARGVEQMRSACRQAGTLDGLRGYEGKASAFYFGAVRTLLDSSWGFQGRAYHPPPDPFNALLSFGYALLQKDVETTLQQVGLDPYLGCLHAIEYGRPALVLDLMEEFRPLLVDQAMVDLVQNGKLKPSDFVFTQREERPVEIGEKLLPVVIRAYESRGDAVVRHTPSDSQHQLRRCLELQARIYARVIMGERQHYEGVTR